MFVTNDESTGNRKYTGRSVAKVIDNVDPRKEGRIRVFHPFIGESGWIDYLRLPGQFSVPKIEDLVYLEADAGNLEFPIAWGNLTKEDDADIPEAFKRSKPTNRGMFTPGGHLLELDDGTGLTGLQNKGVRLTTSGGKKIHLIEDFVAQDNKILLEDEIGDKIEIDVITSLITITTANGSIFTMDGILDAITIASAFGDTAEISALNGIQLSTPAAGGTSISMNTGTVEVSNAQSSITLDVSGEISLAGPVGNLSIANTGDIELANAVGSLIINAAGQVELKGVSDGVVALLQEFAQELATDTFAGFGAPAGKAAIYAAIALRAQAILAT